MHTISRTSKECRQYYDQEKTGQIMIYKHSRTQKTKDLATGAPLKSGVTSGSPEG